MSRPYAYAPDQIDRRLNEGWDAVRKAVARLLVLTGWTLGALPREGRMVRAVHRAVCAVLRPAEKQARRIIIVLARRLPAPTLPAAKPVSDLPKSPQTVQITPRGPLHAVLNPEPARPAPAPANPTGFRLIEPSGIPSLDAVMRPQTISSPTPPSAPRLRVFDEGEWRVYDLAPKAPDHKLDTRPTKHISARIAALQNVLDNPARYSKRMARWLMRKDLSPDDKRHPKRFSPLHWKSMSSKPTRAPRHGGWYPPPRLDVTLDFLARRALDSP